MSKDELLDLVDEKDRVIGEVWKSQAHKDPTKVHREVAVAVYTKQGETLLQRRSLNKKHDPGVWQIAAAGHVAVGEDPRKSAERELFEETGINAKLTYMKKSPSRYKKESRIFWIYYVLLDKKVPIKINKNEVEEARWVKFKDLKRYFDNETFAGRYSYKLLSGIRKKLGLT